MVFHWSLSDNKSPQVSRTLLSILAVLNNVVFWMVSNRPPNAPITIGIIITCMFYSFLLFFFNSLASSRYLSFFSHSFSFILWSAGIAKSTILHFLFFVVDYYYVCYYYYNYYLTKLNLLHFSIYNIFISSEDRKSFRTIHRVINFRPTF